MICKIILVKLVQSVIACKRKMRTETKIWEDKISSLRLRTVFHETIYIGLKFRAKTMAGIKLCNLFHAIGYI